MSAAVLLLALDALPLREKLATGRDLRSREHMGVAPDELFVQAARDVVRVERPLLPRELRVQRDLQKKVAQLVAETRRIARVESGERLVGLLQKVRAQRDVRLLAVPGAPVGCAKPFDDAQHRIDGREISEGLEWREEHKSRASTGIALGLADGARAVGLEERHRMRGGIARADKCPVGGGIEDDGDRAKGRERMPIEAARRDEIDAGGPALENGGERRRATRTRGRG